MRVLQSIALLLLWLGCLPLEAETLRAESVIGPTNVDWTALARARLKARRSEGVRFVLPDHAHATYQQMRRALWLAALHGLTDIACPDGISARILTNEIARASRIARQTLPSEVAIRDVSSGGEMIPLFVGKQVAAELVGPDESCSNPIVLRCNGATVIGEKTGVEFTSHTMSAAFVRACQRATDFICEEDGDLAPDVFVGRLREGVIVVNLLDTNRHGLVYRHGLRRLKFDLASGEILALRDTVPDPLSRATDEPFVCELWKVTLGAAKTTRIVPTERIGTFLSEDYLGPIDYETTVLVPPGTDIILRLDTGNEPAEVSFEGKSLGTRAWEPFEWRITGSPKRRRLKLGIRMEKRTRLGFLLATPTWRRP